MRRTAATTTEAAAPASLWRGLLDSASLMVGYFSIALSFGILAARLGFSPAEALLVSAAVYAGASQFALVTLLAGAAAPLSVAGVVAAMNLRHLFYGPALLSMLPKGGERLPRPLLAFGMTDEVFALASGSMAPERGERWLLGVQLGAYGAWLAGTMAGSLAGTLGVARWPAVDAGLGFVLPALFMALLFQFVRRRHLAPLGISAAAALVLSALVPGHAAMLAAMVAGGAVAAATGRGEEDEG
jgi:Predicted branched-chain amino acid permease (azaleucine resistance)